MRLFLLPAVLLAMGLAGCTAEKAPTTIDFDRDQVTATGALVTEELLSRETFMMYEVDPVFALHYAEVTAAYGALELAGLTGRDDFVSALTDRYERTVSEDIPNTENHVDANVLGVWPLELYIQSGDEAYLERGIELADGQWVGADPETGLSAQTRYWIDDIWMIGALQMQAYRATGDEVYLTRAAHTAAAYIERLQQPNGLFHHGPDAPFYWGRGNGWVAAGIAEIIDGLPEDNEYYDDVVHGYQKMMRSLLEYQAEDGMWRQLIDYPEAWKETSGTAMIGYAMAAGINNGLLDEHLYGPAVEKAWAGLQGYIEEDGRLSDVCVGTGQSLDENYYLERPTVTGDLHGQAPLLWFASELLSTK